MYKYEKTRKLIESDTSKFIFTGQRTKDANVKLYHFAFVALLAISTFGLSLFLLQMFTKRVYHGDIFLRDGPNPITTDVLARVNNKFNTKIDIEFQTIELVIDTGASNFIIGTSEGLYFQVNPNARIFSGYDLINKEFSLHQIDSLNFKSHMSKYLSIKVNDEDVGALYGGAFPRLEKLMQTLAKDVAA